jgi:hypothetical protein
MNSLDIEPPHVPGLEALPFFVAEAMARRERIGIVLVLRQYLFGAQQLNQQAL